MQKGLNSILVAALITTTLLTGCKESSPKPEAQSTLTGGMSQAEVCAILGNPNGNMTSKNETTLLFNGITLKFIDDHLVPLSADVKQRVDQRIAGAQLDQNIADPAPKKKSILSVVKPSKPVGTGKVTHPLAIKGKKAMYEAARTSYQRECAVTGDNPNNFPSYEKWIAEN